VGDEVLTSDGLATQVINVFPQGKRPIYRIRLSDGGETRCTADHLWRVREEGEEAWKTVPLAAIISNVLAGKRFELPEVGDEAIQGARSISSCGATRRRDAVPSAISNDIL
jgi:phosphate starvation-inducible PhoH-like protein